VVRSEAEALHPADTIVPGTGHPQARSSYLYDLYHNRLDELNDAAFADALDEYIREHGEPPPPPPGAVAP